jgi:hypothetical protein
VTVVVAVEKVAEDLLDRIIILEAEVPVVIAGPAAMADMVALATYFMFQQQAQVAVEVVDILG